MDERINDLRILHLALGVEESLEKLQAGLAKHLKDPIALQVAAATQKEGPAHKQLREAYEQLNHAIANEGSAPNDVALLEALFEGEKQARSFYREWADRLQDPKLQDLFAAMEAEEQHHVELIGTQIARLEPSSE